MSMSKGPGEIVAETLMSRQADSRAAMIVLEGPDDSRFWRGRGLHVGCDVIIGSGKSSVIGAIGLLSARKIRGVLGVADDDFDTLEGTRSGIAGLLYYDCSDLEMMLLRSQALDRVIAELADPVRVQTIESTEGKSVRDALIERALPFGSLRWAALRSGWSIDFRRLSPW